ncbi:MAG: sulfurtransferase [Herminiimonas sp.]|nr:sulfurtransferase [Herminiimonas sp.]
MPASPAFTTLVSATELAAHRDDLRWVILDCRHDLLDPGAGRAAFTEGHIPGARFAAIDTALSDKSPAPDGRFRGRHPLPPRAAFIETLRDWGIDDRTQVVAYDAHGGMFAARLWWMLRWVGHLSVAVLDGGLPAWRASGLPLTTGAEAPPVRGTIEDRPTLTITVQAQDIVAGFGLGKRTVIDARAPDRFRGENETMDPVGGHIPGAKNRFFKDNLQADGRFRPAVELHAAFAALVDEPAAAIMQCGSGVTACHNLLAMEVAGLPGAALYPGSWSEWCADEARPMATGPA